MTPIPLLKKSTFESFIVKVFFTSPWLNELIGLTKCRDNKTAPWICLVIHWPANVQSTSEQDLLWIARLQLWPPLMAAVFQQPVISAVTSVVSATSINQACHRKMIQQLLQASKFDTASRNPQRVKGCFVWRKRSFYVLKTQLKRSQIKFKPYTSGFFFRFLV